MSDGGRTLRQEIVDLLERQELSFEELRRAFQLSVRQAEDDLKHVERSLRRGPRRLVVTLPRCGDCDFVFGRREPRRFHTPSRCPRCRSERVHPMRLRVE